MGLDSLLERAGLAERLQAAGYTATDLAARAIYWIALLVVFLLTAEALDVEYFSDILTGLIGYLPLVVVAIIIVIVAAALGAFLAELSAPWSQERHIRWLPATARWMVIGFGVFAALNTLNIAEEIVNTLFIAVVGTVGGHPGHRIRCGGNLRRQGVVEQHPARSRLTVVRPFPAELRPGNGPLHRDAG